MQDRITGNRSLSPRLAGAIFFAIFAFVFTLFAKYVLLSLQQSRILPIFPSMAFAIILGAFMGALYGKVLAKEGSGLRAFLVGILLACVALILTSVGLFVYTYFTDVVFFNALNRWQDNFVVFGAFLLSLVVTIGLWLIPLTAMVAVYFNKHFWPGLSTAASTEK